MITRGVAAIAAAFALSACSTVTDVVPTGKDTYMVGSKVRGGFTSDTEVKVLAVKRANEFCAGQGGKTAQVISNESGGLRGFTPQTSEVQFACVAP